MNTESEIPPVPVPERRFGGSENLRDRRGDGLAHNRSLMAREHLVRTREALASHREETADRREGQAQLREHAIVLREEVAADHERDRRCADGLKRALESHIVRLRAANEHLVIAAMRAQSMTEQVQRAKDQMAHMAHHDFLTGLPNRLLLMERLGQAVTLAKR